MANTQISTMLATTAVFALAACGGGGSSGGDNASSETTSVSNHPKIIEERILLTRPGAPSEGIRRRLSSDGQLELWYDNELATSEDGTYIQGSSVFGNSVEMFITTGDITGGFQVVIDGQQASTLPVGSHTYIGDAVVIYTATSTSQNRSETIAQFGRVTAAVDFASDTGTVHVLSNDARSELNIGINSISSDGSITGNGRFEAFGDTFTVSSGIVGSVFYSEDTYYYDTISEQSSFHGAVFGNTGLDLAGLGLGQSHIVGVLGSR